MTDILKLLGGIVICLAIIGVIIYRVYIITKNKEEAIKYLENFANTIYKNMIKLITEDKSIFTSDSLEEVEKKLLAMIYDSVWDYIEICKENAKEDEISKQVLSLLTRDFVDRFVDTIIEKFAVRDKIKETWEAENLNMEEFVNRLEQEDKALQEKFADDNLYNEEFDEKHDLNPSEASTAYHTNEDGTIDEIEKPADVEVPDLDIVEGDGIEIIGEDGLTESEREAGIHFNKRGRKVDKHGRFVKSK